MPITETEKEQLKKIFDKMNSVHELMKLTGLVYDTILKAGIKSEPMMALGKLLFARVSWQDVAEKWVLVTTAPRDLGNPTIVKAKITALNENVRFPLVRAAEEFLKPGILDVFEIVPEASTQPPPEDTIEESPPPGTAPPEIVETSGDEDAIAAEVAAEAAETALNFEDDEDPSTAPPSAKVEAQNGHGNGSNGKKKREKAEAKADHKPEPAAEAKASEPPAASATSTETPAAEPTATPDADMDDDDPSAEATES